jgi:hypothetical protein
MIKHDSRLACQLLLPKTTHLGVSSGPNLFLCHSEPGLCFLHDRLKPSSGAGCSSYGFRHHITLRSLLPGFNLPLSQSSPSHGLPSTSLLLDPPSLLCELGPVIE